MTKIIPLAPPQSWSPGSHSLPVFAASEDFMVTVIGLEQPDTTIRLRMASTNQIYGDMPYEMPGMSAGQRVVFLWFVVEGESDARASIILIRGG